MAKKHKILNIMYQTIRQSPDKKINFKEQGNGKAIVLLHGFLESLDIWKEFSNQLSKEFRVITIDLPGHGKSESIDKVNTMELMADCVKAVLDYLKINNCIMLGHSMGGYTTLAFADKYPDMLKGFGLFHSSALADTPETKENRNNIIKIVKQDNIKFVRQFITSLFAPENVKIYEKDIIQQQDIAIKMSKQDIIAAIRGMAERKSMLEALEKSKVPVLFIIGKKDPRISYDKILAQATLPKHSEILMLDNVGHMGYLEAKNETLKTIKCFAEKIFL